MTFAEFIKQKLNQSSTPMTKFCSDMGFNRGTWSKILNEKQPPPKLDIVAGIVEYFNLTSNEIELMKALAKDGRIRMFKRL